MSAWQPIASAPRVKTLILFAVTDVAPDGRIINWQMATGWWSEAQKAWVWNGSTLKPYDLQPTHWMPLPEPPSPEALTSAPAS